MSGRLHKRDAERARGAQRAQSYGWMIAHSKVTRKGQTTIPARIRKALGIKGGDKIEYAVRGAHATIRVFGGTRSLSGVLASKKGQHMSFAEIRRGAIQTV